ALWIEPVQLIRYLETGRDRPESRAVRDQDVYASAFLACERRRFRSESYRNEPDPGQAGAIQRFRQLLAVDPGSTDDFEWSISAAADGYVRGFEESDSRVQDRFIQAPHVGRRVRPGKRCAVKIVGPSPSLHLDDCQVRPDLPFGVQEHRQLADR